MLFIFLLALGEDYNITLLVPSTVVLLGRWNWWPSRMSRVSADQPTDQAPRT